MKRQTSESLFSRLFLKVRAGGGTLHTGTVAARSPAKNPVVWVTEFYVTPFDMLIRKEPENSLVSDLGAEQIVGFRVSIGDFDEPAINGPGGNRAGKLHVLGSYYGSTVRDALGDTDTWMDGILIPANGADRGGGTAVAPDSWARIKASFSQ